MRPGRHLLMVGISDFGDAWAGDGKKAQVLLSGRRSASAATAVIEAGTVVFDFKGSSIASACGTSPPDLPSRLAVRDAKIVALAGRMLSIDGARHAGAIGALLWRALLRQTGRSFGGLRSRPDDGWLNPGAIQRVAELVEDRMGSAVPVAAMAAAAGLGGSAFLRAFRGSTGIAPAAYVVGRRVETAATLLSGTDLSVSAIARLTGFNSPAHFSTAFTARLGRSPRTHRAG